MAEITAAAVKSLRERTGLPMMDCKKALQDANGNEDAAVELLRKAGIKTKETRIGRETSTGRIAVYADVQADVAKDVAMHVVASKPQVVSKEDLDKAAVDKEREILSEAARKEGKPENIIAKMIEGRLKNFFAERVLLEQPFVKEESKTVGKV